MIFPLAENMTSLMDIKVYGHSLQTGSNACDKSNKCSYICVGAPHNKFSCLCPDGMTMSTNGECLCPGLLQPQGNKTCPQLSNTCAQGFFTCSNKLCIPNIYRCDGDDGKQTEIDVFRKILNILWFQTVETIRMKLDALHRSTLVYRTCSNVNQITNAFQNISSVIMTMVITIYKYKYKSIDSWCNELICRFLSFI